MAEALGAASAMITLGAACKAVVKITRQIRNTPDELLAINNEVADLQLLISQAQIIAEEQNKSAFVLEHSLRKTVDVATQLRKLLEDIGSQRRRIHLAWLRHRHRALRLQSQLREANHELNQALTLLNV